MKTMNFFNLTIFLVCCISVVINCENENVGDYLHKQSKMITSGSPSGMLPRGTINMVASDDVDDWFNLNGKGIGEYAG